MGSLTFIKPGLLTSLQDQGRSGLAFYAIPRSGPLDHEAAELANTILLNDENAPTIECNFVPPTIRFDEDVHVALTGSDMHWQIDDEEVPRNETLVVHGGSVLSGIPATNGCRSYIAIHGSIQTERTFGSSACYAPCRFGGNRGEPFRAGDQLNWETPCDPPESLQVETSSQQTDSLWILPGPEFEWLTTESKSILLSAEFSVANDSNRMGARLSGPDLKTDERIITDSLPLLPGFMQLTPSGQTIVVLQDGQTTGGYPRIAFLPTSSLCKLNQIPVAHGFRFSLA